MEKKITLSETAVKLLADYQNANTAFLAAEKELYDTGGGVNSDDKLVKSYNEAYDARLHAGACFAACVSSEAGEVPHA